MQEHDQEYMVQAEADDMREILDFAVKQFGRDRSYTVKFGLSGRDPMVWVKEDDDLLASVWLDEGEIRKAQYHK